jgi:hypothetical protein
MITFILILAIILLSVGFYIIVKVTKNKNVAGTILLSVFLSLPFLTFILGAILGQKVGEKNVYSGHPVYEMKIQYESRIKTINGKDTTMYFPVDTVYTDAVD